MQSDLPIAGEILFPFFLTENYEALTSNLSEKYRIRVTDEWLEHIAAHHKSLKQIDLGKCYRITDDGLKHLLDAMPDLHLLNLTKYAIERKLKHSIET